MKKKKLSENTPEKTMRKNRWLIRIFVVFLLFIGVIYYMAQNQEGNYLLSVYLNQDELYKKGIDLSETGDFMYVGAHLESEKIPEQIVTTESRIPGNLFETVEGSQPGKGYMAYSFYIRNAGHEDSGYQASISVNSLFRNAESALRVKVWRNDQPVTCRMEDKHNKRIYEFRQENFLQGYVEKYTIAIWLDEQDPDYRREMNDAKPQLVMNIDPV